MSPAAQAKCSALLTSTALRPGRCATRHALSATQSPWHTRAREQRARRTKAVLDPATLGRARARRTVARVRGRRAAPTVRTSFTPLRNWLPVMESSVLLRTATEWRAYPGRMSAHRMSTASDRGHLAIEAASEPTRFRLRSLGKAKHASQHREESPAVLPASMTALRTLTVWAIGQPAQDICYLWALSIGMYAVSSEQRISRQQL